MYSKCKCCWFCLLFLVFLFVIYFNFLLVVAVCFVFVFSKSKTKTKLCAVYFFSYSNLSYLYSIHAFYSILFYSIHAMRPSIHSILYYFSFFLIIFILLLLFNFQGHGLEKSYLFLYNRNIDNSSSYFTSHNMRYTGRNKA